MRTAAALCLLAVLCTVDAFNGLNQLKDQLQKSKTTVDDNIFTLDRLVGNTQADTRRKAMDKLFEQMQNYNNYLISTQNAIRTEVEAAKAEGKNGQPCYDSAFATLRDISTTAKNNGDRCIQSAENSIKSKLGLIETLLSTGRQLKSKLDSIFPSCYTNDIFQMQSCIAIQMGTTNRDVRAFESDVSSAENTARSASNNVVLQASNCVYGVYSISKITDVRLTATRCLKAL